jgi:hypothetical protein
MSSNIRISFRFELCCVQCGWRSCAPSAGLAEDAAIEHIETWADNSFVAQPNYNHDVEVVQKTVIGRGA